MLNRLSLTSSIDDVFNAVKKNIDKLNTPWSVAELCLSKGDVNFLSLWINQVAEEKNDVINISQETTADGFSNMQMLGTILLCIWAEKCRENSSEGSVWPVIRNSFPPNSVLKESLFLSNGQPTMVAKVIIFDAVVALDMRHAFNIEGTQEWFETIKLQSGFTIRGAKGRLAEWLVNLGRPHAVQYLNGDTELDELSSISFRALWTALIQYRRSLITEDECRSVLKKNPWVKDSWLDQLLISSRSRIKSLGTGDTSRNTHISDDIGTLASDTCPVSDISLDWKKDNEPRIKIYFNRETIEEEVSGSDVRELAFVLDGLKRCQWRKQRNGEWAGPDFIYTEPERSEQKPNPFPKSLLVLSGAGNTVLEWNLADSGFQDEVLVFDMERNHLLKAGYDRIEHSREYTIVCDKNCEVIGCVPVAERQLQGTKYKAVLLPKPVSENICISYDDFLLWQPVSQKQNENVSLKLSLTTSDNREVSFNDRSILVLNGVPDQTEEASLLIHKTVYDLVHVNNAWLTEKKVTISPELVTKSRRLVAKIRYMDRSISRKPRMEIPLLGVVAYSRNDDKDVGSLEILKYGDLINRSDSIVDMQIFTPIIEKDVRILEGGGQVGWLRNGRVRLSSFNGHGGELTAIAHGKRFPFGVSVHESGCVRKFRPFMLERSAKLYLNVEKELNDESENYNLQIWDVNHEYKSYVNTLSSSSLIPTSKSHVWEIKDKRNPLAIAVTYRGLWIGAWINEGKIRKTIQARSDCLNEREHALLKWFRVPVLQDGISETYSRVIANQPRRFIKTWLQHGELPLGLEHHESLDGLDSVVRHFLWTDLRLDKSEEVLEMLTPEGNAWKKGKSVFQLFDRLILISPVLLWKGFQCLYGRKKNEVFQIAKKYYFRQIDSREHELSESEVERGTARLKEAASQRIGIDKEEMEAVVTRYCGHIGDKNSHLTLDDKDTLHHLGENITGRKYIAAIISREWLKIALNGGF